MDAVGHVRITDFGLTTVTQNLDAMRKASDEDEDSARWIAPEILDGRGTYSKEADVFSFAMVTIEVRCSGPIGVNIWLNRIKVFDGTALFSDKLPRAAMLAIAGGERPLRPTHPALTDRLWMLTQQCWDQEFHLRPNSLRISCTLYVSPLEPWISLPDRFLMCSGIPAWKRLVNRPLTKDERISLITDIFSDPEETEVVKRLRGDDAQSFVDVIDEVLPHSHLNNRSTDLKPTFPL